MSRVLCLLAAALVLAGLAVFGCSDDSASTGNKNNDTLDLNNTASNNTPPLCDGGGNQCSDGCVDLQTDPRHCGGCDEGCEVGATCEGGVCQAPQDCRETPCSGLTYCDLNTGRCLVGCLEDAQCAAGERCAVASHECVCSDGYHGCDGVCAADDNVATCGDRCTPCPTDSHGTPTCAAGVCGLTCDNGTELCGGTCAQCPSQGVTATGCGGGACVATSCSGGYELCAGTCSQCPSTGVSATGCSGDQCVPTSCGSGYELCQQACSACPATGVATTGCSGGTCVATTCAGGWELCGGACTQCPTSGVVSTACRTTECVADECQDGYLLCADACGACPDDFRATTFTCDGEACIVSECQQGYYPCAAGCCQWSPEEVETSGPVGIFPALALAGGAPHIAYLNDRLPGTARYATRPGGVWTPEDVHVGTTNEAFIYTMLALDGTTPHVAYYDRNGETLWYATKEGGVWNREVLVAESVNRAPLVLDSQGRPNAVYRSFDSGRLEHAILDGGSWSASTIRTANSVKPDMVAGPGGELHIAFAEDDSLHYGHFSGGTWTVEDLAFTVTGTSRYDHAPIAIDVDSVGEPHIVFRNGQNVLGYAHNPGSGWVEEPIETTQGAQYIDLAIDGGDRLHIAYDERMMGTRYATGVAGVWQISILHGSGSNFVGETCAIDAEPDGTPHLAYYFSLFNFHDLRYVTF